MIAAARADMYQLLATGFLHPDRELAAALADGSFAADAADTAEMLADALELDDAAVRPLLAASGALAAVGFSGSEAATGEGSAAESGLQTEAETEALYHELAVEYARLFIGPPTPAVSPYETIHVDSEPDAPALLMVGPSARAVLAAYREAGVNMAEGTNEPPDHIATEFEFMHYLCVKEAAALQAGSGVEAGAEASADGDAEAAIDAVDTDATTWHQRQQTFIASHIAAWVPDFATMVESVSTHSFYPALASLARAFVLLETGQTQGVE